MIRFLLLVLTLLVNLNAPALAQKANIPLLSMSSSHLITEAKPSVLNKLTHQSLYLTSTAFTFFAALGALSVVELLTQYENNPVVIDQFIASQSDPIGQLALGAFVLSQGWTHSTLEHLTQRSKLHSFIPYLGMTVGLVASQIVIETATFMPELKQCLYQRAKCDSLLKKWEAYPLKEEKIHKLFPSLVSMLSSTFLAGILEMGIQKSLVHLGFEILVTSTPAGLAVKFARGIYHVSRFAGFFYIDYLLVDPIELWWQTHFGIGHQASVKRSLLPNYLNTLTVLDPCSTSNQSENQPTCKKDLAFMLNQYLEKNSQWIEFKARKIYQKQMAWTQYFTNLIEAYYETQAFYGFLLEHFKQFQQDPKQLSSILDQNVTLLGVFQSKQLLPSWNDYLYRPLETQSNQINFINTVSRQFSLQAKKINWQRYELVILGNILELLQKKDPLSIAQGIHIIRNYLKLDIYSSSFQQSQQLFRFLQSLKQELGPQSLPLVGKGLGFLWVGLLMQQSHQHFAHFNEHQIRKKVNWYLNSIFEGPTSELDSFKFNRSGYPAQFLPPKIYNKPTFLVTRKFAPWEPLIGQDQIVHQRLSSSNNITLIQFMANSVIPKNTIQSWDLNLDSAFNDSLMRLKQKYSDVLLPFQEILLTNQPFSLLDEHKRVSNELVTLSLLDTVTQIPINDENWVATLSQKQPLIKKQLSQLEKLYQSTAHLLTHPNALHLKQLKIQWSQWNEQQIRLIELSKLPPRLKDQLILHTNKHLELLKIWIGAFQLFDKDYLTGSEAPSQPSCIPITNSLRHLAPKSCL